MYSQYFDIFYSYKLLFILLLFLLCKPGVCNPQPMGCMPPRMAINVAQHNIVNLLRTFFFCSDFVFVYLMCGPRQFFLFQCDPGTPKGWTPLSLVLSNLSAFSVVIKSLYYKYYLFFLTSIFFISVIKFDI